MRAHNIYANCAAPSCDIAESFAVIEHLGFPCAGGIITSSDFNYTIVSFSQGAGKGLIDVFGSGQVQSFVYGTPAQSLHADKAISSPEHYERCVCSIWSVSQNY